MTFSIIGFDPQTTEWGIAVQSKLLAVGAVVPWVKEGVGIVATQSLINTKAGEAGLELLQQGYSAEETLANLIKNDDLKQLRQLALMDKSGTVATFTGENCFPWSGSITGDYFSVQGNRLKSKATLESMATTFKNTEGSLASRLLKSLYSGQQAGGDSAGQQAAALKVVKNESNYDGTGKMIDLRVDDHQQPIKELQRLYNVYKLTFLPAKAHKIVPITANITTTLQHILITKGFLKANTKLDYNYNIVEISTALTNLLKQANFHARIQRQGYIDLDVLTYFKNQIER